MIMYTINLIKKGRWLVYRESTPLVVTDRLADAVVTACDMASREHRDTLEVVRVEIAGSSTFATLAEYGVQGRMM